MTAHGVKQNSRVIPQWMYIRHVRTLHHCSDTNTAWLYVPDKFIKCYLCQGMQSNIYRVEKIICDLMVVRINNRKLIWKLKLNHIIINILKFSNWLPHHCHLRRALWIYLPRWRAFQRAIPYLHNAYYPVVRNALNILMF